MNKQKEKYVCLFGKIAASILVLIMIILLTISALISGGVL